MGRLSTPFAEDARRRARSAWREQREALHGQAVALLGPTAADVFVARVERSYADAFEPLLAVYGTHTELPRLMPDLLGRVLRAVGRRPEALTALDHRREINPGWFQDQAMVAYSCYADRFAGRLSGVREHLDHLEELGITYLHLLSVLAPRPAPNDGGYAIADYRAVDPRLGTMDDLRVLAGELRHRGISLCIDVVINHTAPEHEWARRATAGDPRYRDYYLVFEDRTLPDEYERALSQVFPESAPRNFTWVDGLGWVWTSFYPYQWDLNYANPAVFTEMLEIMLDLANVGVEIFRLDAAPFIWKRLGTDCQNQPEAHLLLQAFRALVRMAAPAVAFKAEAIVPPDELVQYLGAHELRRDESELAYHNQLMVMLWSAAASRDARLPTQALSRMRPAPPGTAWLTYVRCHDDILWSVTDEDAAAVGQDGSQHRSFLVDYYAGDFPGSFARGARSQRNHETATAYTSGTTASLAGIEEALERGEDALLDAAISRVLLLYAAIYGWGGIPMVYMGDEVGLRNDDGTGDDPDKRWLHRPAMDWEAARQPAPGSVSGRLLSGFRRLAQARKCTAPLHGDGQTTPLWTDNAHVLAWHRHAPRFGSLLGVANFDDAAQSVDAGLCGLTMLSAPRDILGLWSIKIRESQIMLPALSVAWMTDG